jgi:hypothetical protein
MDDFLRKIQLTDYAINMYLKSLGKFSLSYYELYTIVPQATPDEFNDSLKELINAGLFVQQSPKKQGSIMLYSALPPIIPILNYYENIRANLTSIKNSIHEIMTNSVKDVFQDNKIIELDSIIHAFQEIKQDIEEDSIIQKQEVEDIVMGMEELKKIKEKVSELHQKIKSVTQTKFADLIKTINTIKTDLMGNIKKKETISLIEQLFKEKFDNMVKEFTNNLDTLIQNEFDDITEPIDNTSELIFQYRNEFKMLLLNMLTNFETKMNKIYDLLNKSHENFSSSMESLENAIVKNSEDIIQNSIDQVSNLSKPIEILLNNYLQEIRSIDKSILNSHWLINSVTQVNEVIQHLIANSKENLTIIIPHLENHITLEQFEKKQKNLKIKIASSDAHTNSIVKSFKSINNLIYRTYQNENLIIVKADSSNFIIGVIQESKDPLFDFIGIGTTFESLIILLDPLIKNIWESAYSDSFHATRVSKVQPSMPTTTKTLTSVKPIIPAKTGFEKVEKKVKEYEGGEPKPTISIPSQIQEIPKSFKGSTPGTSPKATITDLKQKLKERIDFVTVAQPKADDEAGILINNAFNNLVQKLDYIKGDEFGNELQNIADLILEKKGFSVTLHKLRSIINKYREKFTLLDEKDKREIMGQIENWKKKLF